MEHSTSQFGGKSFYQSEPLIARLRGIIRDYPEGVGIIKELIQNADDARATRVEITLDWRTHQAKKLPGDRMTALMGPAMLVYNDQIFTDRDFDSIRSLGQSEKAQDLQKTGRFGVGFNAIYHVTDYPSFISRKHLVFFDPHGWAIPGISRQEPGREWSFAEAGWWKLYPDFMKVYEAGGLPFGVEDFQGTLFRLPLRTEEHAQRSEIRKQPFTKSNVRELLQELMESGEELLLFLKSVQEIRVFEIPDNSDGRKEEILAIATQNKPEVARSRQKILDALPDTPDTLVHLCRNNPDALVSVSYRHEIETISYGVPKFSTWRVVGVIRTDEGGELAGIIEAMHQQQEKVVPWAGAAARILDSSAAGNYQPVKGRVYCFLPLPLETGLPVHINGFFNLNSARDNLFSDSGQTGKDRPRAIWNQAIARHVLSHAYAKLISDLVQDIGQDRPEEFYKLWPIRQITVSKALADLHRCVLQLLYQKKVARSAVEHSETETSSTAASSRWVTPAALKILPSKKWWDELVEPLRAEKIDIPDPPLPDAILAAFKEAGCQLQTFTPANLRQQLISNKPLGVPLKDAPKASLRHRAWVANMLRYCLSDNHRDLRGLPFAILANDTLQVFGYNPIGTIYITEEPAVREIFRDRPDWFIHQDLYFQVREISGKIGVSAMNAAEVAGKLVDVIGSTISGRDWQTEAANPPNANWLALVYQYFAKQGSLPLGELKAVPLVPGNDGKLYKGGFTETPFWCGSEIDAETTAAVRDAGVPLVKAPAKLEEAIAQFTKKHPNTLIFSLTPAKLRQHLTCDRPLGVALQDAPKPSLRRKDSIINLLRYCLSDNHRDLRGLPLAILANDTLQVFGYNPIGTIYIADSIVRQIFADRPEWFLHPDVSRQLPEINNCSGVSQAIAAEVAKKLPDILGSNQSGRDWQPDAPAPPNANWLTLVYYYFSKVKAEELPLEELKAVPLVPGNDGKLYAGGKVNTPLLCGADIEAETVEAVKYFGVSLVTAPAFLEQAIAEFAKTHGDRLFCSLTAAHALAQIYSRVPLYLPPHDQKHYTSFVNFLAHSVDKAGEIQYAKKSQMQLRQLPIYQTNSHEIVSLNDENVYIPGGYEPPELAGSFRLLRLGIVEQEWLPFFKLLEVPVLNRATLIRNCLLPEYATLALEEQVTALAWIRDNLSEAIKELKRENLNAEAFLGEIQKARIARCTDGRLRSPELLYSPESEGIQKILGNKAAFPDMKVYSAPSQRWLDFFKSLGMRATISADDLLACTDNLIQTANRSGVEAVADSCLAVFEYIVDNWKDIKDAKIANSNSTLLAALADKPWLPVERDPEILRQYAAAAIPEAKLYPAKEVCFLQDAHLVASQKPIFTWKRGVLKGEIRNALGFQPIEPKQVLDHFDTIIKTWENDG